MNFQHRSTLEIDFRQIIGFENRDFTTIARYKKLESRSIEKIGRSMKKNSFKHKMDCENRDFRVIVRYKKVESRLYKISDINQVLRMRILHQQEDIKKLIVNLQTKLVPDTKEDFRIRASQ